MPSELYRTYEVLIEESVHPTHPKRGKTSKSDGYKADVHQALVTTNELFQDAVCYYTIMLAGMCRDGVQNPLWDSWMHRPEMQCQLELVIKKLAKDYPKAIFYGATTIEDFITKCYSYTGTQEDGTALPRRLAPPEAKLLEATLLKNIKPKMVTADEETGVEKCGDLMPAANTVRGWLCNPCGNTKLEGMGVYDCLHREIRTLVQNHPDGRTWIAHLEASKKGTKQNKEAAKTAAILKRDAVMNDTAVLSSIRNRVLEIAEQRKQQLTDRARQRGKAESGGNGTVDEKVNELLASGWASTQKGPYDDLFLGLASESHLETIAIQENKIIKDARVSDRFRRLQELGAEGVKRDDHKFSKPLYRLLWLNEDGVDANWKNAVKDILSYVVENTPISPAGGTLPYQSKPQEPLFPHFTNCLGVPLKKDEQSAWGSFDQSALATAAEDLFKYRIHTDERVRKVERLRALKKSIEDGTGVQPLAKENSPLGRAITMRGLANDPRWNVDLDNSKGVTKLLDELIKDTAWETTGYRLRMGTIGGWAGLRQRFVRLERWAAKHLETRSHRLPVLLDLAVSAEQTENRQGFGSADFFRLLTKPVYHHLWTEEGAVTPSAIQNGIKDFVHYYTLYSEWMIELLDLLDRDELGRGIGEANEERIRPISYTFPGSLNRHGLVSQRHLRFVTKIGSSMKLKLFYKVKDGCFEIEETTLSISARRLKRDRILTPDGGSIAALWCPPLMAGAGANLLKEDKAKEEAERLIKLGKHLDRLREKTLADEKLPAALMEKIINVISVTDQEALLRKLVIDRGDVSKPIMVAAAIRKIVADFRSEHPDGSFEKQNIVVALDALTNNLAAFPDFACSVSLMVSGRDAGNDEITTPQNPVHLQVSVGLPFNESIAIRKELPWFPKGSLRGHREKEFRRFFKWPTDLISAGSADDGDEEKVKPEHLWCGKSNQTEDTFQFQQWAFGKNPARKPIPKEDNWYGEPTTRPTFDILSVDLGNRFCAAFARVQVHRDANAENRGRAISPDKEWNAPIYARVVECATLRLQGEDASVWDHLRDAGGKCAKNSSGEYVYGKRKEEYGNNGRGRFPKDEEKAKFKALADAILPIERTPIRAVETMTLPEMGDHLVWRLRRRISRTRNLFKLRWWVHPDAKKWNPNTGIYDQNFESKREEQESMVLQILARSYTRPKREEDEKADGVYELLRQKLAAEPEWKAKFGEVLVETQPDTKGKSKSKKKSKDVIREVCRGWRIREAKWSEFLGLLEDELAVMLDSQKLDSLLGQWRTFSGCGEGIRWEALRSSLESGRTKDGKFSHPLSSSSLLLCAVMEWCLPLRKRHWHWKADEAKPELFMGKHGPEDEDCEAPQHVPLIQGMRGLALRRLDQVLNLRQVCQSFAKIERRWLQANHGVNDLVIKRDDELHDPCPDLLKKSNDLREQRVFQTAHLILTEALGLQLKNPAKVERDGKTKKELKHGVDLHGDYERKQVNGEDVPRCSVIVLEDLSRYRTSQERTRTENSRLMKWAHRKVINKLADMAKPFGITLMLVDPAWSSRFDSRTGLAGIRVKEVKRGFENEMPFAAWRKRVKANGKADELATTVEEMMKRFDSIPKDLERDKKRMLLIPVEGGDRFLPAAPANDGKETLNADKNAAVNIGLRALAHPDRLDIFPRLRTVKKADGTVKVRNKRGHFASIPEDDTGRELRVDWSDGGETTQAPNETGKPDSDAEESAAESSEYPDFFAVLPGGTNFGVHGADKCHCGTEASRRILGDFLAYERPLFLKRVQQVCLDRVQEINAGRMSQWGFPMKAANTSVKDRSEDDVTF
jgi:IS605 OrfB family transposase